MQEVNQFDLEFFELSTIADDPEALRQLENSYYDDEYAKWESEFLNKDNPISSREDIDDWEEVD